MILKGKKTTLRPVRLSDAKKFTEWYSDPDVNKFTSRKKTTIIKERKLIALFKKDKGINSFVIETKGGVAIGHLLFFTNPQDNNGRIGISIGNKDYWSHGYGGDAMRAILKYGFEKLKLNQIHLAGNGVFEYNPRAIRAYEKVGFIKEGVLRDRVKYKNKYYDIIPMSILKQEWEKIKRKTL